MIRAAALGLAVAPVVVPSGVGLTVDQKIELLAESAASGRLRFEQSIYRDANMRAELRRVGLAAGCPLVQRAAADAVADHHSELKQAAIVAIREKIPTDRLADARFVTFLGPPLSIYSGRVSERVDELAAESVTKGRAATQTRFMSEAARLPTATGPEVAPRSDLSQAFDLNGRWNWDSAAQIGLACLEQTTDPTVRPTITVGRPNYTIIPPKKADQ